MLRTPTPLITDNNTAHTSKYPHRTVHLWSEQHAIANSTCDSGGGGGGGEGGGERERERERARARDNNSDINNVVKEVEVCVRVCGGLGAGWRQQKPFITNGEKQAERLIARHTNDNQLAIAHDLGRWRSIRCLNETHFH